MWRISLGLVLDLKRYAYLVDNGLHSDDLGMRNLWQGVYLSALCSDSHPNLWYRKPQCEVKVLCIFLRKVFLWSETQVYCHFSKCHQSIILCWKMCWKCPHTHDNAHVCVCCMLYVFVNSNKIKNSIWIWEGHVVKREELEQRGLCMIKMYCTCMGNYHEN